MPPKLQRWAQRHQKRAARDVGKSGADQKVIETIRAEAKENGATLAHDGEGGLDPRLALDAFREADWECQNPYCPTPKEDLDLDHASGHPKEIFDSLEQWNNQELRSAATEAKGPKDDRFVRVLCALCHDAVHQRERALENGKEPPAMRGTQGGEKN